MNDQAAGNTAPDVTLRDEDGRDVRLSDIWAQGRTVFVFIRHFG
jgi:peroxiredoxin